MKPLGRKYFKSKDAKHNVRVKGKLNAWWLDVCEPNKKADRQKAKRDIEDDKSQA